MNKMQTAYLFRDEPLKTCIRSTMYVGDRVFQILERPWLNNQSNISCIPAGFYKCRYLERSASGKYHNVYLIEGVQGRVGVLTHSGNLVIHTKGCLLIGNRRGYLSGKPAVLSSRTALGEFVGLMEQENFNLCIIGNQYVKEAA